MIIIHHRRTRAAGPWRRRRGPAGCYSTWLGREPVFDRRLGGRRGGISVLRVGQGDGGQRRVRGHGVCGEKALITRDGGRSTICMILCGI